MQENTTTLEHLTYTDVSIHMALAKIDSVMNELAQYQHKINTLSCNEGSYNNMFLNEMLTKLLLTIDNIEAHGNEVIRNARKEAAKAIDNACNVLKSKV